MNYFKLCLSLTSIIMVPDYTSVCLYWNKLTFLPHTTNLQQTTLKTYPKKLEIPFKWKFTNWTELKTWWQKAKLLVLSIYFLKTCFQKVVCCRGVRKCLYMRDMSTYRRLLMSLQLTTFKNIVAKGEMLIMTLNPFPHIDSFWRLCSRRLFENMLRKEEIAQNEHFVTMISTLFNYCTFF